jgi:hypothetical protein
MYASVVLIASPRIRLAAALRPISPVPRTSRAPLQRVAAAASKQASKQASKRTHILSSSDHDAHSTSIFRK